MTFVVGIIVLAWLIGCAILDYGSVVRGEVIPFDWLQIGIFSAALGLSVNKSLTDGLERTAQKLAGQPTKEKPGRRVLISRVFICAAILACFLFGSVQQALIGAFAGFIVGILIGYTAQVIKVDRHNREVGLALHQRGQIEGEQKRPSETSEAG